MQRAAGLESSQGKVTVLLPSRSSRSSLGAGISSPLLGKDPALADAQQMDTKGLRTLALSSLEQRRLRGDLTAPYRFLRRASADGAPDLFSHGSSNKMCGKVLKLHQGRFRLDIRKHFFTA